MLDVASDQATGLRKMFEAPPGLAVLPLAAVRRDAGFHSLVANIAAGNARLGRRVLVIDTAARGVAHLLGLRTPYDLSDLLSGERDFHDVVVQAAEGLHVLKAQKGIPAFVEMSGDPAELFLAFRRQEEPFDVVIIAGHVREISAMTRRGDDLVLVTNPDGNAIAVWRTGHFGTYDIASAKICAPGSICWTTTVCWTGTVSLMT